ncbi:MAG TPA: hypothetical protein VMT62_07440 [Syntrophorhabdaceae bacterium]|nr:hypothetical protein [Syntrophorhabdaceae bacterium]
MDTKTKGIKDTKAAEDHEKSEASGTIEEENSPYEEEVAAEKVKFRKMSGFDQRDYVLHTTAMLSFLADTSKLIYSREDGIVASDEQCLGIYLLFGHVKTRVRALEAAFE